MGIWNRLFGKSEKRAMTMEQYGELFGIQRSASGVAVNENTSLMFSPWFAGVNLIADSEFILPFNVYQTGDSGKELLPQHPLHDLLNVQANTYQSAVDFRHLMTTWALNYGNAYAEIERNASGQPIAFWFIPANRVIPRVLTVNGDLLSPDMAAGNVLMTVYDIAIPTGGFTRIIGENMIHLKFLSTNGVTGKNTSYLFRDTIGLGLAQEQYANRYFSNNARPGGALKVAGKLNPQDVQAIKKEWHEQHGGLSNVDRVALLQNGMDWVNMSNDPEAAQLIASRTFSIIDVCRILRIKPHMLGILEKSSYSSIEAQNIEFVTYTMLPWLRKWESEMQGKSLTQEERGSGIFVQHDTTELLRGDTNSMYSAFAIGRQWGWLSANDCRRKLNLNAIANGDVYLEPLNMVEAGKQPMPTPTATPAAPTAMPMMDDSGDRNQRAIIQTTYRSLLADVCGRIVRREQGARDKAKDLNAVYSDLGEFMRTTLLTPSKAYLAAIGQTADIANAEGRLSEYIKGYCGRRLTAKGIIGESIADVMAGELIDLWNAR